MRWGVIIRGLPWHYAGIDTSPGMGKREVEAKLQWSRRRRACDC